MEDESNSKSTDRKYIVNIISYFKIIRSDISRTKRIFVLLILSMLVLESAAFISLFALRSATGSNASVTVMNAMYSLVTKLFFIFPMTIPLAQFMRSVFGRDACLMQSLPLPPRSCAVSMIVCTAAEFLAAEVFRSGTCFLFVLLNSPLTIMSNRAFMVMVFDQSSFPLYLLSLARYFFGIIFLQLYICMVSLLAGLSRKNRAFLTAVYGLTGGIMIVFSFAFLTRNRVTDPAVGTVFGTVAGILPQMIYFIVFSIFFFIICSLILKRYHETE